MLTKTALQRVALTTGRSFFRLFDPWFQTYAEQQSPAAFATWRVIRRDIEFAAEQYDRVQESSSVPVSGFSKILNVACFFRNHSVVKKLLDWGIRPDKRMAYHHPVLIAMIRNDKKMLDILKSNLSSVGDLHAARNCNTIFSDILEHLELESLTASSRAGSWHGKPLSPLALAAILGTVEQFRTLLAHGAKVFEAHDNVFADVTHNREYLKYSNLTMAAYRDMAYMYQSKYPYCWNSDKVQDNFQALEASVQNGYQDLQRPSHQTAGDPTAPDHNLTRPGSMLESLEAIKLFSVTELLLSNPTISNTRQHNEAEPHSDIAHTRKLGMRDGSIVPSSGYAAVWPS
ncbi:hypothetical protein P154DRAFT_618794 [Amniculicola lignicola CBS 123094]|uniref:Ankyrin n=1 Tax=Amniculicola lignicola CBS 123094 TaxID=1392246 RepID=A0A6A5WM02_9PLEO|nr:hypothetical protein P154DRAFT_618794 [Amniculicola lignicola CBS 123094]